MPIKTVELAFADGQITTDVWLDDLATDAHYVESARAGVGDRYGRFRRGRVIS